MRHRAWSAAVLTGYALFLAGCGSAEGPSSISAPTSPVPVPITALPTTPSSANPPTPTGTPNAAATVAPTPAAADPIAFFRAQQTECAAHAAQTANPEVEADRFSGARVVRPGGGNETLIADGRGTQLMIDPVRGVVLPASGNEADVMPRPYGFGCSEKVFLGAAAD